MIRTVAENVSKLWEHITRTFFTFYKTEIFGWLVERQITCQKTKLTVPQKA